MLKSRACERGSFFRGECGRLRCEHLMNGLALDIFADKELIWSGFGEMEWLRRQRGDGGGEGALCFPVGSQVRSQGHMEGSTGGGVGEKRATLTVIGALRVSCFRRQGKTGGPSGQAGRAQGFERSVRVIGKRW